jgi:hypothetical protein
LASAFIAAICALISAGSLPLVALEMVDSAAIRFLQSALERFKPPVAEAVVVGVVAFDAVDVAFFFEPHPDAISSTPTRTAQINFSLMYRAPFQR